ncbi:MAG: NUDIX hydrolase [Gammaproteobacteria bacterium]|jgi:8-oxo-dGTP pyrophosphatase MutT (NUDIX family)|nr:NUDIX hydrolase [Gammaproteobacteria bacterium]
MTDPSTPIPAATILMLRDGPNGLETFMVVRHHQIDFASGALVFPGGKIDDGDFKVRDFCNGVSSADDTSVGLMAGAIREAFEECGILLARENGVSDLISGERLSALEPYRDKLHKGELSFAEFLAQEHLTLACDKLQHFAHWITPPVLPKRFDTHFYLASAPADHLAIHDGHESVDSIWITPADAAKGESDGTYTIIFPTLANVEMLGESESVESAMDMANNRNIVSILPWTEEREDGTYVCIPDDAGYTLYEQKFPEQV